MDGFEGLCLILEKKDFPLGEAAVGVVTVTGIADEISAGGIVTVNGEGELGTIVGTGIKVGEPGVVGANSLASESPSCVSPGGSRGA